MKRIAKFIAYHPKTITIIAVLLLIPAAIGYINTFVNYDILSYLPGDIDSVKGENELDETFNSASMSFLVIEDMPSKDVAALKEKIAKVDNVSSVIWVNDIADISIPQEIIPQAVKDVFYSKDGKCTMMLIQYKYKAVTDETMKAIEDVRGLLNNQCFLSGMGVIMKDTRDLADSQAPIFIAIAIAIALVVMTFCMESWVEPWVLLAALCMAVVTTWAQTSYSVRYRTLRNVSPQSCSLALRWTIRYFSLTDLKRKSRNMQTRETLWQAQSRAHFFPSPAVR